MPTLTRLLALILFAGFAVAAGDRFYALFDDPPIRSVPALWFGVIGAAVGWTFVGGRVRRNLAQAAWIGVQGVLMLILWSLIVFGILEVFARGYARQYDGVTEALVGWFVIAQENLTVMAEPGFALFLLVGGVVSGLLCGLFFRVAEARRAQR
ncbi:MAG: TrgA family protein [Rhodobacteraceae bacterium]|nr:TrgA family protein [Paracoccaceae bacterium]